MENSNLANDCQGIPPVKPNPDSKKLEVELKIDRKQDGTRVVNDLKNAAGDVIGKVRNIVKTFTIQREVGIDVDGDGDIDSKKLVDEKRTVVTRVVERFKKDADGNIVGKTVNEMTKTTISAHTKFDKNNDGTYDSQSCLKQQNKTQGEGYLKFSKDENNKITGSAGTITRHTDISREVMVDKDFDCNPDEKRVGKFDKCTEDKITNSLKKDSDNNIVEKDQKINRKVMISGNTKIDRNNDGTFDDKVHLYGDRHITIKNKSNIEKDCQGKTIETETSYNGTFHDTRSLDKGMDGKVDTITNTDAKVKLSGNSEITVSNANNGKETITGSGSYVGDANVVNTIIQQMAAFGVNDSVISNNTDNNTTQNPVQLIAANS